MKIPSPAAAPPAPPAAQTPSPDTAREFEAAFLTQTVDEMLKTVKIGMFGGGHAEETWRSFLARAVADQIAAEGSTGIARSVGRAMDAYQGGQALPTEETK